MHLFIKTLLLSMLNQYYGAKTYHKRKQANTKADLFEYTDFQQRILSYLERQKNSQTGLFSFSINTNETEIYSNTYALMLYGLLGAKNIINCGAPFEYIYSLQDEDGFFRDKKLQSVSAEEGQGWGWYHLTPHVIITFDYQDQRPKYDFNRVIDIFEKHSMYDWLVNLDWKDNYLLTSNYILNVGVLLQYSRDNFNNSRSGQLVAEMKEWLVNEKFDNNKMLKNIDIDKSKFEISKAVKTMYHIAPIFIYDNEIKDLPDSILKYALLSQNKIGGYGPNILSDACQDIDSLYLLSELGKKNDEKTKQSINNYIQYVFINQNIHDSGFVFRRYKSFTYGNHKLLSSSKNVSNLFATWFRTLSVAFACNYLNIPNHFVFSNAPGYQYKNKLDYD